jgi:L-threonylcarbamoyladenylate synthase
MHLDTIVFDLTDPAGWAVARAAALIRQGKLVAFPTETVYGLGADATSDHAVARIYSAKRRPSFNPLICHVCDQAAAQREGLFSEPAQALADAFWPGPLTLVVPAAPSTSVCALARAGLATIGLRVPAHAVASQLVQMVGRPIAAPSANRSGAVSATTAAHVLADFGRQVDMVLDGGATTIGLESTIVACDRDGVRVLRPGGISREAIEAALGHSVGGRAPLVGERPAAAGMLASHYAPRATLRLNAQSVKPGEVVLDFGGQISAPTAIARDLSRHGDLAEAAANLFAQLRALDATGARIIAVAPIPREGLGEAINDRLMRAAAPRD